MANTSFLVDLVCAQRERIKILLALLIASALFLGLSALYIRPGDETYPILVIDIVLVVVLFVSFSVLYWYCTKRAMEE
jgi:CHASE2 domain-containing sensor protein